MQYMLLIYGDPALEPAEGTPDFDAMMEGYFHLSEKMKADGVMLGGEGLMGVETATSLRVRGGKVETMDGPFAETREHLGGYYVIDVPDLDAALTYAALIPSALYGTVEVRPVMDYSSAG
ncbi:YciI family protein [Pseudoruegeria sp. SHC-113]|uniref:YciI family protein n=1 Tax=Pseudoruegeria sp. SHC-113 TaxID=2855439 RepID=UPI0021BB30C1|nr:YciI family protein [Pseudoruegeria sp. SHC-113]MCT8161121.1 YciI family protein [Pseudoruegeria sp. SHC-113]